jgi:hypothetical protein
MIFPSDTFGQQLGFAGEAVDVPRVHERLRLFTPPASLPGQLALSTDEPLEPDSRGDSEDR